jgi:hypothetical protein
MKVSPSKKNILIVPMLVATSIVCSGIGLMAMSQVAKADPPPWSNSRHGDRDWDRDDGPPPFRPDYRDRDDGPPPPRLYNRSRWNGDYDYPQAVYYPQPVYRQRVYRQRVVPRFNINIGF